MIKNIIFDFGGVILKHKHTLMPDIMEAMFPNHKEKALEIWYAYDAPLKSGKTNSHEFLLELAQKIPVKSLETLKKQWSELYKQEAQGIDWELLELIEKLKKKYKVYLFTDTIDVHDEQNKSRGIYEKFHRVFKSFEEKIAKVEGKHAFTHVLGKIQADPAECIFIDDLEKYVEYAQEVGMKGIVYKDLKDLREKLVENGIAF